MLHPNAYADSQLPPIIDCEHDAATSNKSYRNHRIDKRKLMKVYLYTNQLK